MRHIATKRPVMRHADDCALVLDRSGHDIDCDCSPEDLRARVTELEHALRLVLDSATPRDVHHPTMSAAWRHATRVLERK